MKDLDPPAFTITPTMAWSGTRYIDCADPKPEDFSLWEIATGLSREGRYGGSCTSLFWSVAQHSVLALRYALEDGETDRDILRAILMHDAPEYMLRDMIRPVKKLCPDYRSLENFWWSRIAERFGLPAVMPALVRKYDDLACSSEKAALVSPRAGRWPGLPAPRDIPLDMLMWTMDQAKQEFLIACKQLGIV